ncbi:MAG: coenzyme A pyrophosphatase [Acidimicrobiaceae bacterium]|nr:coenzyme A pyrophosphatase [Acidimicrobiaceae bacterium]
MEEGRGGSQKIPRPESWHLGAPAPWGGMEEHRDFTLDVLESAISGYNSRTLSDQTKERRRSAVLIPIYCSAQNSLHLILTRRSAMMKHHTHEVSFPGGNQEPEDQDLWATAIREAHEEIGLDPELPRLVGTLDSFVTVGSNSLVTPFVGILDTVPALEANAMEVEEIIDIPLTELLDPNIYREEVWQWQDGRSRPVYFFELIGDTVWGATASMLRQFLLVLLSIDQTK